MILNQVSASCPVFRFHNGKWERKDDTIVCEEQVTIVLNGTETASVTCSPRDLEDLAVGFLLAKGKISESSVIESVKLCEDTGRIYLDIKESGESLTAPDTACEKLSSKKIPTYKNLSFPFKLSAETVTALAARLQNQSVLFEKTGGVHCAALSDGKEFWVFREDVGRFNTLDKLYGHCIRNQIPAEDKLVVFSGRMFSEIVSKVASMGCGILISRSAPTAGAIALAKEVGMTLIGFTRGDRFNVYSGEERLIIK